MEDRPRYNNSRCFETFPFPDPTPEQKETIRTLAEQLDTHRKRQQAQHPDLKVLLMSGYFETGAGNPIDLAPKQAYLPKPFTFRELCTALADLLGANQIPPESPFSVTRKTNPATFRATENPFRRSPSRFRHTEPTHFPR